MNPPLATFENHHPLGFRLADSLGLPSVFIVDDSSQGRHLNLIITNTSARAIEFSPSEEAQEHKKYGPVVLAGAEIPHENSHHLEIVFRPGTFNLKDVARFAPVDSDWCLHGKLHEDHTLSLYLGRREGYFLPPGGVLTITISQVKAAITGGSRSSQALLRYHTLHYAGESAPLSGHRLTHLDVVNHRGRSEAPLIAGFIGSAAVLNDGETRNSLTLYIGNPSLRDLSLAPGELDVRPRLLISIDCGQLDETDEPWALGHADEVAEISITTGTTDWVIHRKEHGPAPSWILLPPQDVLKSNAWINFSLYPIVTRAPSGFARLHLAWQNISGYRDGHQMLLIEKSPRLYRQKHLPAGHGKLGDPPRSQIVHAFAGGMVVGSQLAADCADDETAPPAYPRDGELQIAGNLTTAGSARIEGQLHVKEDTVIHGKLGLGTSNPARHLEMRVPDGDGMRITGPGGSGTKVSLDLSTYDPGAAGPSTRILAVDEGAWGNSLHFQTRKIGAIENPLQNRLSIGPEGNAKFSGTLSDKDGLVVPKGIIVMWSGKANNIPPGWALCDRRQGTPDLRGRFIVGYDPEQKDYSDTGKTGGEEAHTLTIAEMPSHNHGDDIYDKLLSHDAKPQWTVTAWDNKESHPEPDLKHFGTLKSAGGDKPHENRPPYYVLAYIMKL